MISITEKEKCCGCTACSSICPQKAIEMVDDEEGFKYPQVDETKCIKCDICKKVCPVLNENLSEKTNKKQYACQSKDELVRYGSTSGGVFFEFAHHIVSCCGLVYAVGFDSNMSVIHKCASNKKEIESLIGSKYVQSDLLSTFSDINNNLLSGKKVLFIGTPCQVAGLSNYINKKYHNNLYLIDLICYGVPSPGLYKECIKTIEQKYNNKVVNINFRDKKFGYAGNNVKISLKDGTVLENEYVIKAYLKTMFSNIGLRPACYNCRYRGNDGNSDITIGDMHNICDYSKKLDDNLGTSYINIHSKKGSELFKCICENIKYAEINDQNYRNGSNNTTIIVPRNRDSFFSDKCRMEYEDLIKKYFPQSMKNKVVLKIKDIFGNTIIGKKIIKKNRISRLRKKLKTTN